MSGAGGGVLQAARAPQAQEEESLARGYHSCPTAVSPCMTLRGATRLEVRGTSARPLACDLYTPPPPPPSSPVRTQTGPSPVLRLGLAGPPQPSQNPPGNCGRGEGRERPPPAPAHASEAAHSPPPPKDACSPGALWRRCQPSRILPASLEWKITASNFAEELVPAL